MDDRRVTADSKTLMKHAAYTAEYWRDYLVKNNADAKHQTILAATIIAAGLDLLASSIVYGAEEIASAIKNNNYRQF